MDSARKILDYTKDLSFNEFINDSKTVDAVIRNFEIIGEAANRLPDEFKDNCTSIDWVIIETFLPSLVARLKEIQ